MGQTNSCDQAKASTKAVSIPRQKHVTRPVFATSRLNSRATIHDDRPPTAGKLLQRRCQCGNHTIARSVCDSCRDEQETIALSKMTAARMADDREPSNDIEYPVSRFAQDFSQVPVHSTSPAQPQTQAGSFAHEFAAVTARGRPVNVAFRPLMDSRPARSVARVQDNDKTVRREAAQPAEERSQEDILEDARRQAQIQVFRVHLMLGHLSTDQRKQQLLALAHRLICPDLTLEHLQYIIWRMWQALNSPRFVQIGPEIPQCSGWDAYTPINRQEIHACESFFRLSEPDRVRTMVHESAHAAGVGQLEGEAYLMFFDCETSYNDEDVADAWSHFVHCALGGAPDEIPAEEV